ncbi:DUF6270 domain-containing protein [Butyrivibrio sp. XPD2002]|uniref:DUF6270 domain-containing protein n=1 Tax=Butyrivibrio sp. XPD2002 TaxID=1280665 RepID=UPI00041F6FFF|nr:DUF6270 domain-containing protein [Butyrivibrio sp. XPD2002]
MLDKNVSLSLIGCCAIRDIFGLQENDGDYKIKKYVQNVSPISAVMNSPLLRELTDNDAALFSGKRTFITRCQRLELEKRVFEYIAEDMADYLVIDAAEFRRKLFVFPENNGYFSENYNLKALYDGYINAGIIPGVYDVVDPMLIEKNGREALLQKYCDRLCDLYEPDKIILVEIKAGGHHVIDDERLCAAEDVTADIFNERISYAYDYFKKHLIGTHIIEFPDYVSIDPNHKWGRNLLHFVKEYYDYALSSMNIITSQSISRNEEKNAMAELKSECENKLLDIYFG